jgi:DNA-binding transcriptional LysR family regulator
MDMRLLRYFVACVECKSMHAAAEAVHVSQPALSKAIAELEAEVGAKLLDRLPRGVLPTAYGDTLYRYAKVIENTVRSAVAEIDAMRGMTRGTIIIGVIPTLTSVISDVAIDVLNLHPGLNLKIRVGFSSELLVALQEGELDVALLFLPGESSPMGIVYESLVESYPAVVVRKEHPLTLRPKPTLKDLSAYHWLIPDFPAAHKECVDKAYFDAGLPPPQSTIRVSTAVLFASMISRSDLIGVLPSSLLQENDTSELGFLETEFGFPLERVGLAFREHNTLLPGARKVMDLIRARCTKFK